MLWVTGLEAAPESLLLTPAAGTEGAASLLPVRIRPGGAHRRAPVLGGQPRSGWGLPRHKEKTRSNGCRPHRERLCPDIRKKLFMVRTIDRGQDLRRDVAEAPSPEADRGAIPPRLPVPMQRGPGDLLGTLPT